jgi:NAD/NADP transhydrogenase beta subunit
MTKMPELVALMHSFVGLSAVLIAIAAVFNPAQDHWARKRLSYLSAHFIGAITFTASIIAFGKLSGKVSGKPVSFFWSAFTQPNYGYLDGCRWFCILLDWKSCGFLGHVCDCSESSVSP